MDIKGLRITEHARKRFIQRLRITHNRGVHNPQELLTKLLQIATPDRLNFTSYVNRSRKFGNNAAYYKTRCGWRFVVVEEENRRVLVTCERKAKYQNHISLRPHAIKTQANITPYGV